MKGFCVTSMTALTLLFGVSCSEDATGFGGNAGEEDSGTPDNAWVYDGILSEIQSVVYSNEEVEGCTVFWLSPTANVRDKEGMEAADDYARIVVGRESLSRAASEETVTIDDVNGIEYKSLSVNAGNISTFSKVQLTVRLTSAYTVRLSFDIVAASGKSIMRCSYIGVCSLYPQAGITGDATCTTVLQNTYFGSGRIPGSDAHEFYTIMASGECEIKSGSPVLKEEFWPGFVVYLDLMTPEPGDEGLVLPEGEYNPSLYRDAFSYDREYSFYEYYGKNGQVSRALLSGSVTVQKDEEGMTNIVVHYLDDNRIDNTIVYKGSLSDFADGTTPYSLPQLSRDAEVKGVAAQAVYYGDMGRANGSMMINIYDEKYNKNEEGGYGATLLVTNELFPNVKDANLRPGTYEASDGFAYMTWFIPVEINYYGIVSPIGTYVHHDDGTNYGRFGYAQSGTVTIAESERVSGGFRVEFDLRDHLGRKLTGSYEGLVPVDTSQAITSGTDDGTSTLTMDYTMDLSQYTSARLLTPGSIWIEGIGLKTMEQYHDQYWQYPKIGYQVVAFGNVGADGSEGDIAYIELLTGYGQQTRLKAGTYEITPNRYPLLFHPGVAVKGMLLSGEDTPAYLSHWEHMHLSEGGHSIMDGHAYFYGGSVTVSGPDTGGNYTFDFDATDVRKHHIIGSWTGPVMNGLLPVQPPVESTSSADGFRLGRRAPDIHALMGFRTYRSPIPWAGQSRE